MPSDLPTIARRLRECDSETQRKRGALIGDHLAHLALHTHCPVRREAICGHLLGALEEVVTTDPRHGAVCVSVEPEDRMDPAASWEVWAHWPGASNNWLASGATRIEALTAALVAALEDK